MSYQFQGQRPDEEVLLIARRHPFVLLHSLLIACVLLLLPWAVMIFLPVGAVLSAVVVACLLGALAIGWNAFYAWKRTTFLLTTERAIYVHQKGFVRREFIECSLGSVQQVSHKVEGLLRTMWGYGTLSILAGSQGTIEIPDISEPYEVQQDIQRAISG